MPGDPLAGASLAAAAGAAGGETGPRRIVAAVCASVLLYATGLIQNDLADAARDARERPDRPIPSGAIRRKTAAVVMWLLAGSAVLVAAATNVMAAFVLAVALLALISLYNCVTSGLAVVRPVNMGLCRGVSLLLGAAAVGGWPAVTHPLVLVAAVMLTLYVAAVTAIAANETAVSRVGRVRWAPAAALVGGLTAVVGVLLGAQIVADRGVDFVALFLALGLSATAVAGAVLCGRELAGLCPPERTGRTVGMLIRWLLVIQAALVAAAGAGGLWVAAALLLAWPVAGLLARRFASS